MIDTDALEKERFRDVGERHGGPADEEEGAGTPGKHPSFATLNAEAACQTRQSRGHAWLCIIVMREIQPVCLGNSVSLSTEGRPAPVGKVTPSCPGADVEPRAPMRR